MMFTLLNHAVNAPTDKVIDYYTRDKEAEQ